MLLSGCKRPGRAIAVIVGLLIGLSMQGCAIGDMSDLEAYIKKINARKSKKIEPIPPPIPPEIYAYASSDKVDPFQPFVTEEPEIVVDSAVQELLKEHQGRVKEELEFFPLDALRLVGTLEQNKSIWALVTAPDGAVHRVEVGNYVGRNYGKVMLVAEDHLELMEIVPDSLGSWQERPARLELAE